MEFLVEFEVEVPARRRRPRSASASGPRRPPRRSWRTRAISYASGGGLYRAARRGARPVPRRQRSRARRSPRCAAALRVDDRHRHRARAPSQRPGGRMNDRLPEPRLSLVYRLEARLGEPLDLGDTARGRRRIVPLTGGTFAGPELAGSCSRARAPTGRSSCRTAPPSGTSATRCRPTPARCSTSNRTASATAAQRSSRASPAARTSTRASTSSAPPPGSPTTAP